MSAMKYWLWLSTSARMPPRTKSVLLEYYGSPEAMYMAPVGEITRLLGDKAEGAEELERRDLSHAASIIDRCSAQGIDIITVQDAAYPERLRNVYAPPHIIYVKGKLPLIDEEPVIALIGTRNASPYGIRMGRKLGYEITKCGGIVVSGLTAGIDAAGAQGALSAEGTLIGVLGVPHELAKGSLAAEVSTRGALISEYPPGTKAYSSFFRARNRITAGLSVGVAVVEAPEKSGTRLFVAEAADQGKEIFVVPGNADSDNCAGSNAMLREGAKAVTCGWDIMCEFERRYPDRIKKSDEKIPKKLEIPPEKNKEASTRSENKVKKVIDKKPDTVYIDSVKQIKSLTDEQRLIISVLEHDPVHVDEIIEKTGLSPARVLSELTMMQLSGIVGQESGKRFISKISMK